MDDRMLIFTITKGLNIEMRDTEVNTLGGYEEVMASVLKSRNLLQTVNDV